MAKSLLILGSLVASSLASPLFTPRQSSSLTKRFDSKCVSDGWTSCQSPLGTLDTCCHEVQGLIQQSQFWDTAPATGPTNSWTIHGLWPNYCNDTYEKTCDPTGARAYVNISGLLRDQGADATLDFMTNHWVNINGNSEQLWEHEWEGHGTCFSTLQTSCIPPASPRGAEAVDYFNTVVTLFKTLPTYDWLASASILPSETQTYTLDQFNLAVYKASGLTAVFKCRSSQPNGPLNIVNQVQYNFNLKGSAIDGQFVPINPPADIKTNCVSDKLFYIPKISTQSSPPQKPTVPETALLRIGNGGLLKDGSWSADTYDTFHFANTASGFTMSTSAGNCGIVDGVLKCGSGIARTPFSQHDAGGARVLTYGTGNSMTSLWSSHTVPSASSASSAVYLGGHFQTGFEITVADLTWPSDWA